MFVRSALWAVLAITVGHLANGEVSLIRDYRLHRPRDRRTLFTMAVTPDQHVLSFIANREGKWRLSRVKSWLEKEPQEDITVVPGLAYGDREQWFSPWIPKLFVTSDGQFVICITSAWRSRGRGQDEFISVVGLADFKVVASVRSPTVAALAGDYRLHDLDRQNRLVIQAHAPFPRHPGDDITAGGSRVKMAVLSVPSLVVASQCEYTEWIRTRSPTRREDQGSCEDLLATYGDTTNLADLINTLLGSGEVSRTDLDRRPSQCAFLGYARYLSPDGRYEREICQTDHRGFWGTPVITKSVENIFSVKTGEQVGSIDEPITSVESRFAPVNGQEYLLVMEGGTRLMIYRIAD